MVHIWEQEDGKRILLHKIYGRLLTIGFDGCISGLIWLVYQYFAKYFSTTKKT